MDSLAKSSSKLYYKDQLNTGDNFFAEIQFFDVRQFIWVDEAGSDDRDQRRKFGYSLRGEAAVSHQILHRGRRVSAIAAMSTNGVSGCL